CAKVRYDHSLFW
nr:immunoglobulin heavy chain junction region [Macaca mulatta]